ncbi:MAG: hypothetical protein HY036_04460 [Nitrospirae bacterium]|nr:hypothetical protein [Nitrospirota bacterium]
MIRAPLGRFFWILTVFILLGIAGVQTANSQSSPINQGNKNVDGLVTDITSDTITVDPGTGAIETFSIHSDQKFRIRKFKVGDHVLLVVDNNNQVIDILILPAK